MESTRVTRHLTDIASMSYPTDASVHLTLFEKASVTFPNALVKTACVLGIASALYHTKDIVMGTWRLGSYVCRRIAHCFRSYPKAGTVVIYGATNKIGRSYAMHFAEEGAKLVLIDHSFEKLSLLRQKLIKTFKDIEDNIICCTLGNATSLGQMQNDGGLKEIYKVFKAQKEITYFINCRNIKKREITNFHTDKTEHIILMTYYNMTIFAAILRKALKSMSEKQIGRVICVNTTYGQESILRRTHPLFFSTSQFAVTLTQTLMLTYKDMGIQFLVVNSNYRNVASTKKYSELVDSSLSQIGLSTDIYI